MISYRALIASLILSSMLSTVNGSDRLQSLTDNYERARSEVLEKYLRPVDEKYLAELRLLMDQFAASGRIDEVVQIKSMIRKKELELSLPGQWIWAGDKSRILVLHPEGRAEHTGWDEPGAWLVIDESTIRILAEHTSFRVTLDEGDQSGEVVAKGGGTTTIERKK